MHVCVICILIWKSRGRRGLFSLFSALSGEALFDTLLGDALAASLMNPVNELQCLVVIVPLQELVDKSTSERTFAWLK